MRFQCTFCFTIIRAKEDQARLSCPNCAKQVAVPKSRLETGCVIDDFVIKNVIGYGGMATVYLVQQLSLDRPAALKVLSDEYCGRDQFRKSFLKEAKAAARLNHPNIIQATRVGEEDGLLFYAMEYVQGQTLAALIDVEKTLQIDKALNVTQQCAEALHDAWTQEGLIHRDIKPENIMLAEDGYAKIMDLGIAITVEEAESAEVSGTPTYMAPEQFRRERLDCRTDIYSLGVTLYQALIGFPPYDGENVKEIARKHIFNQLQFPSNDLIYLPQRIKRLVSKMMAKEPSDRYQDYEELLGDIVALRKRLAPDRDQVPNVHTISFSKYRLHEKMSDSPSEIYRRRTDKKKKVAIAKEQSTKSEKQVVNKGPWIVIAGLLVAIVILVVAVMFAMRGKSDFVIASNDYLSQTVPVKLSDSPTEAVLEVQHANLEGRMSKLDDILGLYPADPGSQEKKLKYSLLDHRYKLRDQLLEVDQKLRDILRKKLDQQNTALIKEKRKSGADKQALVDIGGDLKTTRSELEKAQQQLARKEAELRELKNRVSTLGEKQKNSKVTIGKLKERALSNLKESTEMSVSNDCQAYKFKNAQLTLENVIQEHPQLESWGISRKDSVVNAKRIFDAVYDSGTALQGFVFTPKGVAPERRASCKVLRIDRATMRVIYSIYLRETPAAPLSRKEQTKEIKLSSFDSKDMSTFAENCWPGTEDDFRATLFDFFLNRADFEQIRKMEGLSNQQKDLTSKQVKTYFKLRLKEITLLFNTGNRKIARESAMQFTSKYGDLEEYEEVEEQVKELISLIGAD